MRSLKVVLPASMCAAIPMLRVLRRSIFVLVAISLPRSRQALRPQRLLPAVVGVGTVRFFHTLHVFFLLHSTATALGCIKQLTGDPLDRGALGTRVRSGHEPAE